MHILITHITFTYTYHFSYIYFFIASFISYHISYTFHVILYFTFCSCNYILSLHSSAMLLISCHIFNTLHLHILVIFFYVSCLHKPLKWIKETIRARRRCTHYAKQWSIRARRHCTHCAKQWSIRAQRRCYHYARQ